METVQWLKGKAKKWSDDMKAILDKADQEKRGLTSDEEKEYKSMEKELDSLQQQIQHSENVANTLTMRERFPEIPVFEDRQQSNRSVIIPQNNGGYVFNEKGSSLRDSFNKYVKYGTPALSASEYRALQADSDPAGGYLVVPEVLAREIITELNNAVFVRQLARKFELPAGASLGFPAIDNDFGDLTWTSELGTGSEDSDLDFGKRELRPHPLARRIKVSNKLLRMSTLNPEAVVKERMLYKMAVVQENAFLNGNGINKPLGVFTASDLGISTGRDISTGNTATAVTFDGLKNAVGALKQQYRSKAAWVMHRDLELQIAKLKDGDGRYIWEQSSQQGVPNMLLGFPVYCSEYAPNTFTTGQYVAALGDFSYFYIVDSLQIEIQRLVELYSETAQTGFIIRSETDGAPVLESAFVRVQLG